MTPTDRVASRRPGGDIALVLVLGLAAMIVSMMQTLVVPILSIIQSDLGTSTANVSWVTTATLLSAAVFTPLLGRFGDMHGKKPTLIGVLLLMIAGSVLAATTSSLLWLIVGRVLQGAATAIFPLALSVLREEMPPAKLHGAMAMVSGTLAVGSGLALVAAGLLTRGSDPDYHRVFWLAVALAAVALVGVLLRVPSSTSKAGGRTDWLGAVTLAVLLVLLLLPISQGHAWGWSSARTIGLFAGAVAMAVVWVLVERKVREPMVDMRMFAHRPVLFTNLAGLFLGFAMFSQFIGVAYLVQMPQELTGYGFGASVLRASVEYLLPTTVISLLAAQFGGILVGRIGARFTLAIGAVFGVLGFVWLTAAHDSSASIILAGLLIGVAISFGYAAMPALIVASVPHHQTGIANGLNSISRSVGSAIASAVITSLLASKTIEHLPAGVPALPAESQFTLSFAIAGIAFVLIVPVALLGLTKGTAQVYTVEKRDAAEVEAEAAVEAEAPTEPVAEEAEEAEAETEGATA